jgi:FMN phosphatase YigB (HAD superfamily)
MPYVSGKRKPDPDFYLEVLSDLKVDPANCIFIDDRLYSFIFSRLLVNASNHTRVIRYEIHIIGSISG